MVQKNLKRMGMVAALLFAVVKLNAQIQAGTDYVEVQTGGCQTNINVLANDNYSGTVQINLVDTPQFGTASVQGNIFSYCAQAGYFGADRFSYSISSSGSTAVANVFINVLPPNTTYFAGDADNNGRVENHDILAIGLAYGATGSQHLFQDSGSALAWDPLPYINSDPGACDGDRNSIINYQDAQITNFHYGQNNPLRNYQPRPISTFNAQGLPLELVVAGDSNIADGDTMELALRLKPGSQNNGIYGISYVVTIDTTCMSSLMSQSEPRGNWQYNSPDSVINFYHKGTQSEFHGAIVRTNHKNWNGGGDIASIKIPVIDNIDGIKRQPGSYQLQLQLTNVRVITAYDVVVPIQSLAATRATLHIYNTGEKDIQEVRLDIYPNPTSKQLFVKCNAPLQQLTLSDALGRQVFAESVPAGSTYTAFSLPVLTPGTYTVSLATQYGTVNKSLLIIP